jgi:hypothetical protein
MEHNRLVGGSRAPDATDGASDDLNYDNPCAVCGWDAEPHEGDHDDDDHDYEPLDWDETGEYGIFLDPGIYGFASPISFVDDGRTPLFPHLAEKQSLVVARHDHGTRPS